MTKDVLLSIRGIQLENSDDDIEIITVGEYGQKDNKHFVHYDEILEDYSEVVKSILKFDDDCVELIKDGPMKVHMIFEKKKKNVTYYSTPYGDLLVGLMANSIEIKEKEELIQIEINYALEINSQHISDCNIGMEIKAKDTATLEL